jgi:2-aminoadipate transaminase
MSSPKLEPELLLARWARLLQPSALQEMLSAATKPDVVSFALGLPAPELFPSASLAEAAAHVLSADPQTLQYNPPFSPLKTHVVKLMTLRGVKCTEKQIFLTAGAQQGLNLITRLLLDPGGGVLMEQLAYPGFQQVIEPYLPEKFLVPTDPRTGMDVDAVEKLLSQGIRPAFIYAIADGHNPMAVSLSPEKRAQLASLARLYRIPIVEDDPYGFLYYSEKSLPPLRAFDEDWVFYLGSFSKILAPSLRAGWVVAPEELLPKLATVKEATDINAAPFSHRVIAAYLDICDIEQRLAMLRGEYDKRRRLMLDVLRAQFPAPARWQEPSTGIFVWVELDDDVNTGDMLGEALQKERVAFIPGNAFSVNGKQGKNCMRLNFSNVSPSLIEDGIARLARVVNRRIRIM